MWCYAIFGALVILPCFADDLIVELPDGKVQGTTIDTPSGRTFYTWRHIPYAKPPVDELRFHPPVKNDPWDGVLDGSKDSMSCLFIGSFEGDPVPTYGYSEDCLYINVYSPVEPRTNLTLPVMFWIYGGGYIVGTGDFAFTDPTPLLEEDVIIVTFNYRLGVFGFLSTEDEVLPGNAALKDQLAALIWTKENIAFFGGNPSDITIFGESAGAISVGFHLVSPKSRDLFTGAIMESGSCILNLLQEEARANALDLASQVNTSITESSTSLEILEALQVADADLMVNLTVPKGPFFLPVLEIDHDAAFMSQPLYEELEAGNITQVPIIIGTNSEELIYMVPDIETGVQLAASYDNDPSLILPTIHLKEGVDVDTVTSEIKQAYVGNGTFADNLGSFVTLLSENKFVRPAIKHALLQSKYTPVFFYQFSFVGTRSKDHPDIPGCGKVGHAEEVGYLFNISAKPIETDADYLARRRMVKLWANFAKTKNPTPNDASASLLENVIWEPVDEDNFQYLDIGEHLELKDKLKPETTAFWSYLWENYSNRPYVTF